MDSLTIGQIIYAFGISGGVPSIREVIVSRIEISGETEKFTVEPGQPQSFSFVRTRIEAEEGIRAEIRDLIGKLNTLLAFTNNLYQPLTNDLHNKKEEELRLDDNTRFQLLSISLDYLPGMNIYAIWQDNLLEYHLISTRVQAVGLVGNGRNLHIQLDTACMESDQPTMAIFNLDGSLQENWPVAFKAVALSLEKAKEMLAFLKIRMHA